MNTLLIADGQIDASYNFLQPLQKMTTEEFTELLGETFILFGVAQFVMTSLSLRPKEQVE